MPFGNWQSMERQGSGLWRSLTDGDFEEEDVWDVLRERKDSISRFSKSMNSSVSVPKHLLSAARMIPKPTINASTSSSNCTSASNSNQILEAKPFQQSAPVTIPNWPNKHHRKPKNLTNGDDEDDKDFDVEDDKDFDGDGDVEEEEETPNMPPHELIARRLARTHTSSFSVLEGVGRKLKGRDLCEVRNAILTKTGFLESL
ncbi:transcription initiation factor TFIID subunit 11 [Tripterygium wilfordii]|uniref:Transcription initiation factor TFIID subunit 11 n=1 Tax=Tripterygium wilfordii TaxID=458696 RepID=A0A7J7C205_TRIWF|nr:uncharacterized protein LOC119989424 [Tripterygium wilfordii]KAF5727955.1 transcription initiation factor TFIID subunit 11 [Tripterygium wilfordii]